MRKPVAAPIEDGDGPGSPGAVKRPERFHSKSVLYSAFVCARRVLNSHKRRFPARAVISFGASSRTYVLRAISAADAVYAGDGPMQRYRRLCVLHMTTTCGEAGETSASRDFPGPPELVQFDAVLLDTGGAPRVHASASS